MTISQSLVLVLLIAVFASGNRVDLSSNIIILIILLISLIALSRTQNNCSNNICNGLNFNNRFSNSIF